MAITGFVNSTYRWRTGFVAGASLTSAYNITSFPTFLYDRWYIPEFPTPYIQSAIVERGLDGSSSFVGKQNTSWTLVGLNSQMLDYVLNNAALFNGEASMDSTISTWNISKNRWEVVWAKTTIDIISGAGESGTYHRLLRLKIDHLILQDAP